ncbi:hypothetical protein ACFOY4_25710 [Actinomadura syzygii]|uniref:Uncharacterized protein n=1 Tax=Actinomadura syzygii TaxID=1427538 RepID=A0A5D0UDH3_9ACTN|nr:hypothetical protein [Actinomadura syzygii]TYC16438.1 hypothetical protein FXF65_07465 [Actinomadura syzygii]
MNDFMVSLIRTWVPVGIGNAPAWLALHYGVILDTDTSTKLKLAAAAVAGYYALALAVERRWPGVGRFHVALGLRRTPAAYDKIAA